MTNQADRTAAPQGPTFAYLRVSTDAQDVANQKLGVLEYCAQQGFGAPVIVEDTVSGKIDWRRRKIGELLAAMPPGSILVAAEITRLARMAAIRIGRAVAASGRLPPVIP